MDERYPSPQTPLRIGTRGSPLALAQAHETKDRLMKAHGLPENAFHIEPIRTTGDAIQNRSLSEIGGKGLFTREIEESLLGGRIDIAVHSMKDMPVDQPDGLTLGCYLPREDVRDAFVSLKYGSIEDLPEGSVVGTSSMRRRAQLKYRRPDLQVVEFRGNVQTRLRKLADGVASATFLAMAGLNRLAMEDVPYTPIPATSMLPAIAQGAIGIEWRIGDEAIETLLSAIHDPATGLRLAAERTFLRGLDGSCQTPIGGLAELSQGRLHLRGEIIRPDGSEMLTHEITGSETDGAAMGMEAAALLRERAGPGFFSE
ncbi:hydroxymethylbilane synthase [Algicella marina]|uniref:Porphobilinogen deaminase n=1 Tax=Algicella marina TaxID=2683284 RepID=A0A6P1T439_9RHOB|nr:hydroxymethylbilane synthase [Algicella marina]QHQ36463.1 hydroxymethylbilane synthase [Algicella marina]